MYGHAYKIYQQSHKSAPTADRMNVSMCMNSHPVSRLRAAKGLSRAAARCFAALSMTGLDLAVAAELSRAFEPCLISIIGDGHRVLIRAPLRFAEAPTAYLFRFCHPLPFGCLPTNNSCTQEWEKSFTRRMVPL